MEPIKSSDQALGLSSSNPPPAQPEALSPKQSAMILLGLFLGIVLEALDTNVLNPAMKTIVSDLHSRQSMIGWVFAAYMLTLTVMTPLYGRLSDMYGRMPFYLGGMALFMLGSILSGLSQNIYHLIAFRALQGLGAGAMMPIAIALGQTVFPAYQRGKIQGAISMAFGVASIVGPTVGGFITQKLSWHWLFYMNLPFGILATILLYTNLPAHARKGFPNIQKKIDYLGAISLILFAGCLMLGFSIGSAREVGFYSLKTLLIFSVSLIALIAFFVVETRTALPLIPLHLFQNKTFSLSILAVFLSGIILPAILIYFQLFLQEALQKTSTQSGLLATPGMMAVVLGSFLCGRAIGRRIQKYKYIAIFASTLMLISIGMLFWVNIHTSTLYLVVSIVLFGFATGSTFPLYGLVISNSVERQYLGVSFGLLAFFRNLGSALSAAVLGSAYGKKLAVGLSLQLSQTLSPKQLTQISIEKLLQDETRATWLKSLGDSLADQQLKSVVVSAVQTSIVDAIHVVWYSTLLVALCFLLVNLALPNKKLVLTLPKKV